MYIEPTLEDLAYCLEQGGIYTNYFAEPSVKDDDAYYYIWMQAHNLRAVLKKYDANLKTAEENALAWCLENPNPNFLISKKANDAVDLAKLEELKPDIYYEYRYLPNDFFNHEFTPRQMIEIMKNAGVTEARIREKVKVNVTDIKTIIEKELKPQIFVPGAYKYMITEMTV